MFLKLKLLSACTNSLYIMFVSLFFLSTGTFDATAVVVAVPDAHCDLNDVGAGADEQELIAEMAHIQAEADEAISHGGNQQSVRGESMMIQLFDRTLDELAKYDATKSRREHGVVMMEMWEEKKYKQKLKQT